MSLVEATAVADRRKDQSAPDYLLDLELTGPLPDLRNDEPLREDDSGDGVVALALVRLHGRPVGVAALALAPGGLDASEVADEVWRQTGPGIVAHFHGDGLPAPGAPGPGGYSTSAPPDCVQRRTEKLWK